MKRFYGSRGRWLLLLGALFLGGCQLSQTQPGPWVPVLENASFHFLNDAVNRSVMQVEETREMLHSGESGKAGEVLDEALLSLLKLQHYYLPVTEARQLIYDADRLYYLKASSETLEKLLAAKEKLIDVSNHNGEGVKKSVKEAILMIEDLQVAIESNPAIVAEKFRAVGERINLMAIKGELILGSGVLPEED